MTYSPICFLVTVYAILSAVRVNAYWSTSGSKIVDAKGNEIHFSGVNWNGFEAGNCVIDGLWEGISYKSYLKQIKTVGFNLIRLPFAMECIQDGVYPNPAGIDYNANPDLKNLTSLEAMKLVVSTAGQLGIKVILDCHRRTRTSQNYTPEDGLWFDENNPPENLVKSWQIVTEFLKNETAIVGVDIFNEPHNGAVWTNDPSNIFDFYSITKKAGEAILKIQPNWIVFVEGVDQGKSWWGADLSPIKNLPLTLSVPNKTGYTVHDYGPVVHPQDWFFVENFPSNLESYWDSSFGYVQDEGIAPVWVGEFGSNLSVPWQREEINSKETLWLSTFVDYIFRKKLCWTWFTWGPNSGGTGGILRDDWRTLREDKLKILEPIFYPNFKLKSNDSTTFSPPPLSSNSPPLITVQPPNPPILSPAPTDPPPPPFSPSLISPPPMTPEYPPVPQTSPPIQTSPPPQSTPPESSPPMANSTLSPPQSPMASPPPSPYPPPAAQSESLPPPPPKASASTNSKGPAFIYFLGIIIPLIYILLN